MMGYIEGFVFQLLYRIFWKQVAVVFFLLDTELSLPVVEPCTISLVPQGYHLPSAL